MDTKFVNTVQLCSAVFMVAMQLAKNFEQEAGVKMRLEKKKSIEGSEKGLPGPQRPQRGFSLGLPLH